MPIAIQEPVKASLVILNIGFTSNATARMLSALSETTNGKITMVKTANAAQSFMIETERISISQQLDRMVIERSYPSSIEDLARLAEVAEIAISNVNVHIDDSMPQIEPRIDDTPFDQRTHTFGTNIEAICRQDSGIPSQMYLASRFMNLDGLETHGIGRFDASWELAFGKGNRSWKITARQVPGIGDESSIFVSLNSHHQNDILPRGKQAIDKMFRDTWQDVSEFVNAMEKPQ